MQLQYDNAGRLQYKLYGTDGGSFSQSYYDYYTYDSIDRVSGVRRGPNGQGAVSYTQYTYDNANQLTCTAVRMNASQFGSDPSSACTQGAAGADGADQITQTSYNADGTTNLVTTGLGASSQRTAIAYHYNSDGTLFALSDGNNNYTCNYYDGYGRLTQTQYANPSAAGQCNSADYDSYGYDSKSEMTSWRRRDGQALTFAYDALGNVTSGIGGDTYSYDNNNRLTQANRTTGGSTTVNFTYDALGRKTASNRTGISGNISYAYDAAGNRTQLKWPDGNYYVTYSHDPLGRTTAILEAGINTADYHQIATYAYDSLGRLSSATRANAETLSYGYDGVSRLSSIAYAFPNSGYNDILQYQYDEAGQVIWKNHSNSLYDWHPSGSGANITYGLNGLNEVTSAGGGAFSYDAKGNPTSDGSNTYRYNGHNWMMNVNSTALNYDGLGRLYSVTANGTTTEFLYDGANLIGEYDTNNNSLRRYVPGVGGDDYVSWVDNTGYGRLALLPDPQGSVLAVATTAGSAQAINTYDEYGMPGSGNLGRIQYTGQVYMPEVGLYNYKARMYSPALGRFMQTDPIGYGDGMNWYAYAHNSPLDYRDPTGTFGAEAVAGFIVGAGVGAVTALVSGDTGQAAVTDIAIGAVSGGFTAALSPSYVVQIGAGVIFGGGGELFSQVVKGEGINFGKIAIASGTGALAGALGAGVTKLGVSKPISSNLGKAALAAGVALHTAPIAILGGKAGAECGCGAGSSSSLPGSSPFPPIDDSDSGPPQPQLPSPPDFTVTVRQLGQTPGPSDFSNWPPGLSYGGGGAPDSRSSPFTDPF